MRAGNYSSLNDRLRPELPALVRAWLPSGRLEGHEWVALNPLRNDRRLGSFKINLHTGSWADFAIEKSGVGAVSLYAYLFADGDWQRAAWELLSNVAPHLPAAWEAVESPDTTSEAGRKVKLARSVLAGSHEIIETQAELYLGARGLSPTPAWKILRFRMLKFGRHGLLPTLIAPIVDVDGAVTAVQRIFLSQQVPASAKAVAKQTLGKAKGGAVRLGRPKRQIIICEGVEDGLALSQTFPGKTIWAVPGASFLWSVVLPGSVAEVVLAPDNDKAGEAAALRAADAFLALGKRVSIMHPSKGCKDWNEQLLRGGS